MWWKWKYNNIKKYISLIIIKIDACNINESNKPIFAEETAQIGCAYIPLYCKQCNNKIIGRKYISTTKEFDKLRDYYTFYTFDLIIYNFSQPNDQIINENINNNNNNNNLIEEINKLKLIVLSLAERIMKND